MCTVSTDPHSLWLTDEERLSLQNNMLNTCTCIIRKSFPHVSPVLPPDIPVPPTYRQTSSWKGERAV